MKDIWFELGSRQLLYLYKPGSGIPHYKYINLNIDLETRRDQRKKCKVLCFFLFKEKKWFEYSNLKIPHYAQI